MPLVYNPEYVSPAGVKLFPVKKKNPDALVAEAGLVEEPGENEPDTKDAEKKDPIEVKIQVVTVTTTNAALNPEKKKRKRKPRKKNKKGKLQAGEAGDAVNPGDSDGSEDEDTKDDFGALANKGAPNKQ
jgi:hypothetical protein